MSHLMLTGAGPSSGGSVPVTLVWDQFNGADNTALPSHAPDTDIVGGGWLRVTGVSGTENLKIQGNAAQARVADANAPNHIDVGRSDYKATAVYSFPAGFLLTDNPAPSLMLRWPPANTGRVEAFLDPLDDVTTDVAVVEFLDQGSGLEDVERIRLTGVQWAEGETLTIALTVNGATVSLTVTPTTGSPQSGSGTLTTVLTGTKAGFFGAAPGVHFTMKVDSFLVESV